MAFGSGYLSAGLAMVLAIAGMVVMDAMHPPAASTALGFGLRAGDENSLVLFCMAAGITVLLIVMQWIMLLVLRRLAAE
jgi:CBS-domain-containing membrane protein